MSVEERRGFYRDRVDVPGTLYLNATDELRRPCRIVNLGGGGCEIELQMTQPVAVDSFHELRFSLPNRPGALVFDCELVAVEDLPSGQTQRLHARFVQPRPGYQDSVINYVHNRRHLDKAGYKVAMPVCMDPLRGSSRSESCMGMTVEAGRTYALAEFNRFTTPIGADVRATFLGPRIINETSLDAKVDDLTRTLRGFKVRLSFEEPTEQVMEFVRKHYAPKAKRVSPAR